MSAQTLLTQTVVGFADDLLRHPDEHLDFPWSWGSYESEGIRFGVLRVIEELVTLKAHLLAHAARTETDLLLSEVCAAYWDLDALLRNLPEAAALEPLAAGEWDVRTAYAHIVGGELGFYGVTAFALEQHRAGTWRADVSMTEAVWDRILDLDDAEYTSLMNAGMADLREAHVEWHEKTIVLFRGIAVDELDLPSKSWETELLPLRFRLGRCASHMRQHTIQIEKTLTRIHRSSPEIRLLLRQLLSTFGAVEPFSGEMSPARIAPVQQLVAELRAALQEAAGGS